MHTFSKTILFFVVLSCFSLAFSQEAYFKDIDIDRLANGEPFFFWEKPVETKAIYYVDKNHPKANDSNPGTESLPFRSINAAATILGPGEKVFIKQGTYRETIHPAKSGTGPGKMIVYEAFPGDTVVIKGTVLLDKNGWEAGKGWEYSKKKLEKAVDIWQYKLHDIDFNGYNPFGMLNLMHDREYFQYKKEVKIEPHFKRRGTIFIDGEPLEQVLLPVQLAERDSGAFWVEHNGLTIHVRFPGSSKPSDYIAEAAIREQLFVPRAYGFGYIKLKGLVFEQSANGFPVPQRGMVSSNRGHHWVIEDCIIQDANSLGVDLGNEMWHTVDQEPIGHHVFRRNIVRNCGISGLQAMRAPGLLIEDNLFEHVGWQDAELAFESGGIKLHRAKNTLIRRNVFRHIRFAPGIWLDYKSSRNCRVTRNVFSNIITARGGIYIEASHGHCRVDHNIFYELYSQFWLSGDPGAGGSALYTDGSDSIYFDHNLAMNVENSGYTDYLNAERIVGNRGGVTRWHRLEHNIFTACEKHAIEFPNQYNFSDGNLYGDLPGGYLKMANPAPALLLDLDMWRTLYGWDLNGGRIKMKAHVDTEKLTLTLEELENFKKEYREAGPFKKLDQVKTLHIDPRKLE